MSNRVTNICPVCGVLGDKIIGDAVHYKCGTIAICNPDGTIHDVRVNCEKKEELNISELLAKLRETRRTVQIRAPHDRHWHVSLHDPNTQEIVAVGVSSELTKACIECLQHYRRD